MLQLPSGVILKNDLWLPKRQAEKGHLLMSVIIFCISYFTFSSSNGSLKSIKWKRCCCCCICRNKLCHLPWNCLYLQSLYYILHFNPGKLGRLWQQSYYFKCFDFLTIKWFQKNCLYHISYNLLVFSFSGKQLVNPMIFAFCFSLKGWPLKVFIGNVVTTWNFLKNISLDKFI